MGAWQVTYSPINGPRHTHIHVKPPMDSSRRRRRSLLGRWPWASAGLVLVLGESGTGGGMFSFPRSRPSHLVVALLIVLSKR